MGQKIHPTGFRVGINKVHTSKWFANYQVYREVLKEDYQIRKLFESEFKPFYNKAGISKLEIHRKIKQLGLVIHVARPKLLTLDSNHQSLVLRLTTKLEKIIRGSKQIRIKVFQISKSENESSLVAMSLADQLEKRVAFRKAIRQTTQLLQKIGVTGFKIQVSGRLNGAEIARAEWVREGRVPLQTIRADISYASYQANTIYGILGIKVWIFSKEVF